MTKRVGKTKKNSKLEIFEKYVCYFLLASCIGWVYEMIYCPIVDGDPIFNRGFLFGPWLPVYGFGGILIIYLLHELAKKKLIAWKLNLMPIVIFALIFLIASIVEYFSHWLLDTQFGISLWDYSEKWLNINGRVSFMTSVNFGIIGIIAIYWLLPLYDKLVSKMSTKTKNNIVVMILTVLSVDLLATIFLK